jgi:radical SAM superfamily enzyme
MEAVAETKARGIDVGAHFILGLPSESRAEIIAQTATINRLNIDFVKFHQLQIYHNTPLAKEWLEHRERFLFADGFTTEDYVDMVVDIVRHLDPNIAIERFASQAPRHHILYSPLGGIRMDALKDKIVKRLNSLNARQGDIL